MHLLLFPLWYLLKPLLAETPIFLVFYFSSIKSNYSNSLRLWLIPANYIIKNSRFVCKQRALIMSNPLTIISSKHA